MQLGRGGVGRQQQQQQQGKQEQHEEEGNAKNDCSSHQRCCGCGTVSSIGQQSMEQIEFDKSACAAALRGDLDTLQRILEKRPRQLESDGKGDVQGMESGYSPLIYASRGGYVDVVEYLLKAGANPNKKTVGMESTALHRAAGQGHPEVVRTLLKWGADACARDCDGQTALHKAGKGGYGDVYGLLLDHCPQLAGVEDGKGEVARLSKGP